jgi:uncharacterized protein YraI
MSMKSILAGAAMLAVAAIPAVAEAQNALTSVTVNFRASPSGVKLGAIPVGSPVTVLGRSGNWCQTEWLGHVGWVHCRYLQVGLAYAPRVIHPVPRYAYGGYPFIYGAPFNGLSLGFGDFDRGFRHREVRRHHFDGRRFGHRGGFGRGGGGGGGSGAFSGINGYFFR